MSIDIMQIESQYPHRRAIEAASNVTRTLLDEQERWRKQMMQPSHAIRSILEQASRYQKLLAPAQLAVNRVTEYSASFDRVASILGASRTSLDAIENHRRLLDQVARISDSFPRVVDQLNLGQIAPWAAQLESAAEHVRRLQESLPDMESGDDEALDWNALDEHLEGVHAAIDRLPLTGTTPQQLHAAGLSRHEWIVVFLTVLGTLTAMLGLLETHAQGQFARDQAAQEQVFRAQAEKEEREYRDRLLAAIGALAAHSPDQPDQYFVVARPVPVRSAISKGGLLDTAHPNQVVVATGKNGRWLKIRYRNHIEGREVEGWALKHYLIRQAKAESGD
ncbi:hypothetical protein [Stenotrophomonas sp. PS02297]|uniref:hypothetical protein n=1 Tax=Stenotrophomonas sp. PS02297 TaxID=2991423 RepID=UPI00249CDAD9|nr:hypothetical protein [Stenotrophomonas sp. PS02297]